MRDRADDCSLLWIRGHLVIGPRLSLGRIWEVGRQLQQIPTGVQPVEEKRSGWGESLVDPQEKLPQGYSGVAESWNSQSGRREPGELALKEDGHQHLSEGPSRPPHPPTSFFQNLTCKSKCCQGAIMNPKSLTRGCRDKPTPPDELLPQAIEFVNQYYSSFKE